MPIPETTDVAIIGGGVIGSACACFLAGEPGFGGTVTVIERDPTYQFCSTARSVGGIRQQFSNPENIRMSQYAADFIRNAGTHLAVDGEPVGLSFVEGGYLFLASTSGLAQLHANADVQQDLGADVVRLTPADLQERFPWLSVDGVAGGVLGESGEGWIDPYSLLMAFRRKARALGVRYVADTVVGATALASGGFTLDLQEGGRLTCCAVVNAAGPKAAGVAALFGADLPIRPRKRMVYVIDCRTPIDNCPLLVDPAGVYVRPESGQFICGTSPPPDVDPDSEDFAEDYSLFEEIVWPTLAARIPAFEAIKLQRAWAGLYAYNTLDQNAILGVHPDIAGLYFANGFSGHGLQQSPAVGRAISELITFGEYRTLDLSRFGYDRILKGEPVPERNVV